MNLTPTPADDDAYIQSGIIVMDKRLIILVPFLHSIHSHTCWYIIIFRKLKINGDNFIVLSQIQ